MGQVNKTELVEAVSVECNLSVRETRKILETILKTMSDAMSRGESIELRGLGTFKVKQYGSYTGRNPKTGEAVSIKPKKLPFFTVGRELKNAVNNSREK